MELPLWLAPGWPRVLAVAVPAALAAGLGAALVIFGPGGGPAAPAAAAAPVANGAALPAAPQGGGLLVDVTGAVNRPGLIRLLKGDRVLDAVAAAGGLSPDADPTRLPDMAQRLRDGQQVKVPARGVRSAAAGGLRQALIDLNAATVDELAAVPGFSPELAAEAVRYRSAYGGFTSTRELVTVLGMNEADFQVARRYLRI